MQARAMEIKKKLLSRMASSGVCSTSARAKQRASESLFKPRGALNLIETAGRHTSETCCCGMRLTSASFSLFLYQAHRHRRQAEIKQRRMAVVAVGKRRDSGKDRERRRTVFGPLCILAQVSQSWPAHFSQILYMNTNSHSRQPTISSSRTRLCPGAPE